MRRRKTRRARGAGYTYDARGFLAARTWAGGVAATYSYNALGELDGINYGDATPDVTIVRDGNGRMASVTAGSAASYYQWNADGALTSETWGNNEAGLLYGYDTAGRRSDYALWGGSGYETWGGWGYRSSGTYATTFTPEGPFSQSFETGTGRLSAVTGGGLRRVPAYDGLGRLASMAITTSQGENSATLLSRTYGYDANGQRSSLTDEAGEAWEFRYNGRGEVTKGVKRTAGQIEINGYRFGTLQTMTFPDGYTYDAIGNRTTTIRDSVSRNWVPNALNQYTNNNVSNGLGRRVPLYGTADPAATVTVNGAGTARQGARFFSSQLPGGSVATPVWKTFAVLEQKPGNPPPTPTETTGHLFYPPGTETFSYDDDGNLTQDGRWNYTWDAENRLVKMETRWQNNEASGLPVQKLEFGYDAFWRRTFKKVSTKPVWNQAYQVTKQTKFAYDGWNLIAEWEALPPFNSQPSTFNLVRTHHWGLDLSGTLQGAGGVGGLVLTRHHSRDVNGHPFTTSFFPAYDGNGNIVALYDTASGLRAAEYEYGPFGEPLRITGSVAAKNPFRWSTKYEDEETGVYYYGYRYFQSIAGRWLGRDPLGERGGLNLFVFVQNRAGTAVDRLGLCKLGERKDCTASEPEYLTPDQAKGEDVKNAGKDLAESVGDFIDAAEIATSGGAKGAADAIGLTVATNGVEGQIFDFYGDLYKKQAKDINEMNGTPVYAYITIRYRECVKRCYLWTKWSSDTKSKRVRFELDDAGNGKFGPFLNGTKATPDEVENMKKEAIDKTCPNAKGAK